MRVSLRQAFAYKLDFIFTLILGLLVSLVMIFVWYAVYANSGVSSIGGLSLNAMYVYFFMVNALSFITYNAAVAQTMQEDVQTGAVSTAMARPIGYNTNLFLNSLSVAIVGGLTVTLPMLLIAIVLSHTAVSPAALGLLLIEVLLSFAITTCIGYVIGTLSIYFVNIWGIINLTGFVYYFLGGSLAPLSLFPKWLANILMLLPSQLMMYTPAATLLGIIPMDEIIREIAVGAVWLAALVLFTLLWLRRISRRVVAVGG
ncbi:ABC-2 family transporter protein [uncultured archaeon]|nr:ABC-2 family transporter protein [uncultured archaeon]